MVDFSKVKKSKNFEDKTRNDYIPRIRSNYVPTHAEKRAGFDSYISDLYMRLMRDHHAYTTMVEPIKNVYERFEQPSYNKYDNIEPYWQPQMKKAIIAYDARMKKQEAEDMEIYRRTGKVPKRKSDWDDELGNK